jgi:hypothetical protein
MWCIFTSSVCILCERYLGVCIKQSVDFVYKYRIHIYIHVDFYSSRMGLSTLNSPISTYGRLIWKSIIIHMGHNPHLISSSYVNVDERPKVLP